jgi:hypothetical protein
VCRVTLGHTTIPDNLGTVYILELGIRLVSILRIATDDYGMINC